MKNTKNNSLSTVFFNGYESLEKLNIDPCPGFIQCEKSPKGDIGMSKIPDCMPLALDTITVYSVDWYANTGRVLFPVGPQNEQKADVPVLNESCTPFSENEAGYLLYDTGKTVHKIANFTVEIQSLRKVIALSGEKVMIRVCIHSATQDVIWSLPKSEWQSFITKLASEHPEFYLLADYPNAARVFKQYTGKLYEDSLNQLPEETFYETAGWYEQDDGKFHYVSGLDVNCNSSRCLAPISSYEEAKALWQYGQSVLQIGDLETLLPLFLQLHIGYTMAFFEKAGHPIQFILALVGPTGSRKTALARCLYCLFDNDEVVNFTATDRAIELIAMSCHDSVFVLDDLSDVRDKNSDSKLNRFLRQVGDSAGRAKSSNGGRDVERVDTRFAVVVTAESSLDCLQQSGQLRTLEVQITPSTVDNAKLREFQNERSLAKMEKKSSLIERYISAYVRFLEDTSEECLRYIIRFEPAPLSMAFDRQAEIYRSLSITATLILRCGVYYGAITSSEADRMYREEWLPLLQGLMKKNELKGKTSNPVYMFVTALSQLRATKQMILAASRDVFQQNPTQYVGFCDGGLVCLRPDKIYADVQAYWGQLGYRIEGSANDLFSRLLKAEISEGYEQKDHAPKKLKIITVNKEKMQILCICWEKAMQYIQEHTDLGLGGNFKWVK